MATETVLERILKIPTKKAIPVVRKKLIEKFHELSPLRHLVANNTITNSANRNIINLGLLLEIATNPTELPLFDLPAFTVEEVRMCDAVKKLLKSKMEEGVVKPTTDAFYLKMFSNATNMSTAKPNIT